MSQTDLLETPPYRARSREWIGRAVFEAALIVFGLVGALLIDEWRDTRARNERLRAALASIRAELEANRAVLGSAIANHETVIARLKESGKTGVVYEAASSVERRLASSLGTRRATPGSPTISITLCSWRLGTRIGR